MGSARSRCRPIQGKPVTRDFGVRGAPSGNYLINWDEEQGAVNAALASSR